MIYKSLQGEIELEGLTRLYAAALIRSGKEVAEMSLEWMNSYGDKVELIEYVLVFDYTPVGSEERIKKTLSFTTKEELFYEMQKISDFIDSLSS